MDTVDKCLGWRVSGGARKVAQWEECLHNIHRALGSTPSTAQSGAEVCARNPSTPDVEAGELDIPGPP